MKTDSLIIFYSFRKDTNLIRKYAKKFINYKIHRKMDLVIINTVDNKNYEVIFENEPIQNYCIRPRFLEFEALQLVLMEKAKCYENFIYCNCH